MEACPQGDIFGRIQESCHGSVGQYLQWRVKRLFGLASVSDAEVGAITFVQRNDGALRLAPHFHTLAADRAWVRFEDGDLRFLALPDPTPAKVAQLAAWTHALLVRILERHGRLGDLAADQPVLASCYDATAGDLSGARSGCLPAIPRLTDNGAQYDATSQLNWGTELQ